MGQGGVGIRQFLQDLVGQDLAELDAFLAGDPYGKAGLFESVTVLRYKKVLP